MDPSRTLVSSVHSHLIVSVGPVFKEDLAVRRLLFFAVGVAGAGIAVLCRTGRVARDQDQQEPDPDAREMRRPLQDRTSESAAGRTSKETKSACDVASAGAVWTRHPSNHGTGARLLHGKAGGGNEEECAAVAALPREASAGVRRREHRRPGAQDRGDGWHRAPSVAGVVRYQA